jgi:hypothetical protein
MASPHQKSTKKNETDTMEVEESAGGAGSAEPVSGIEPSSGKDELIYAFFSRACSFFADVLVLLAFDLTGEVASIGSQAHSEKTSHIAAPSGTPSEDQKQKGPKPGKFLAQVRDVSVSHTNSNNRPYCGT